MPHTHHSHSGQFCNHGTDSLSDILLHMIRNKHMTTIALTEHIPRPTEHLYPDEAADGWSPARLEKMFADFILEAKRLRREVERAHPEVQILVGFEGEWIDEDPVMACRRIQSVLALHASVFDMWVGSVHHVKGEPIDYDAAAFSRALAKCEGNEDILFCSYFDAQYELLSRVHPPVVGHFDLVRLKSKEPDKDWGQRKDVWPRIVRNLQAVKEYGGVLELNSSGLRKGLQHPYPRGEIVQEWMRIGGVLVLSDDSHSIDHVGACYDQVFDFLRNLSIDTVGVLKRQEPAGAPAAVATISLTELLQHPFCTS